MTPATRVLLAALVLGILPWLTGALAAYCWLAHETWPRSVLVGSLAAQAALYGGLVRVLLG